MSYIARSIRWIRANPLRYMTYSSLEQGMNVAIICGGCFIVGMLIDGESCNDT